MYEASSILVDENPGKKQLAAPIATPIPIHQRHFLSLPGVCLEDDYSALAWVSQSPLLSRILFRLFVLFLRSLRSMLSRSLDPEHAEEAPGRPVAMKAQETSIADLPFLIGP